MKIDTSLRDLTALLRSPIEGCISIAAFLAILLVSHGAPCADIAPASEIARVESGMLPRASIKERLGIVETIKQRMDALGIPGVSIAVIDKGRVAWTKAYGVADTVDMTPVTTHTLFQAASISKPIAALGALRLIKEGRLSLDGDVNLQLKSWKIPVAEQIGARQVTVRQLLSHTAGLSVHGFDGYSVGSRIPTIVEVLNGIAPANSSPVRMEFPPGSEWRYSGGGYTVIQRLIEDVSGEPFAKFMQDRVLAELGMTASTFSQVVHASTHRASGHQPGGRRIPEKAHIYPEMAAAGLWTTPEDLASYLVYVQRAVHGTSGALLNLQLASDMLTPQNEGSHGLGPEVYAVGEFGRFGHNGVNAGFESAMVAYIDGGRGLVVMTNSNGAAMFFDEIKGSVARAYNWPGFPIRPQVEVQPITSDLRHRSAGKYRTETGDIAELVVRNRRLFLMLPGVGSYEVFAKNHVAILAPQLGWKELTLLQDGDKVTALKVGDGSRWDRID